jgi:hypothetical protein
MCHLGSVKLFGYLPDHSRDIDDRVAGKDLGQPRGQVAGQAFAWSLFELEFQFQDIAFPAIELKLDVKSTFSSIRQS